MSTLQRLLAALKSDEQPDSLAAKVSETLGITGLLLFALFSLLSVAGANLGLGLMLIALLLSRRAWKSLLREPLFWISLATIGYILLRSHFATSAYDEPPRVQVNQAKDWALLFLYIIPAWWISRSPTRIVLTLALMLGGFSLGILSALDSQTFNQIQNGVRTGLHFGKPIIFGFICAVAILALTALIAYWLRPQNGMSRGLRRLAIGLALLAILFFLQGLVVSQSRGVWLALLVALPLTLLLLWRTRHRGHGSLKGPLVILVVSLAVALIGLALNWSTINQRLQDERQALNTVVNEGLAQAPLTSSTYRLHLWRFGIGKWLERPLVGWGPGTTPAMIAAEEDVALQNPHNKVSFDHLHNAYLELLFQLGAVGFLLVAVTAYLMITTCIRGYRQGTLSKYLLTFLLGNFVLIAVYSLTDFRHLHWNWRFYWMILGGIVLALTLMQRNLPNDSTR